MAMAALGASSSLTRLHQGRGRCQCPPLRPRSVPGARPGVVHFSTGVSGPLFDRLCNFLDSRMLRLTTDTSSRRRLSVFVGYVLMVVGVQYIPTSLDLLVTTAVFAITIGVGFAVGRW